MIRRGGRILGEVEEYFIETLVAGDTFVFAGEILKYEALVEDEVYVSRTSSEDPKVPSYEGGKFPLSTISPIACGRSFPIVMNGGRYRTRSGSGWKFRNGVPWSRARSSC
jgi:Lhr-like helicases